MPAVLLKDLPPKLHTALKARARTHHRSMAGEALAILEAAVFPGAGPPTLAEVDALRVHGARPLTHALVEEARSEGRP